MDCSGGRRTDCRVAARSDGSERLNLVGATGRYGFRLSWSDSLFMPPTSGRSDRLRQRMQLIKNFLTFARPLKPLAPVECPAEG